MRRPFLVFQNLKLNIQETWKGIMSPFLCWEKAWLHIDLKGSLLVGLFSRRFILREKLCITPLLWAPSFEHALIMCKKTCVQFFCMISLKPIPCISWLYFVIICDLKVGRWRLVSDVCVIPMMLGGGHSFLY